MHQDSPIPYCDREGPLFRSQLTKYIFYKISKKAKMILMPSKGNYTHKLRSHFEREGSDIPNKEITPILQ